MTTRSAEPRSVPGLRTLGGRWTSELGSELELHDTDGFLSGRYTSAVGLVRRSEPLIGFCTPPSGAGIVVLAFVVRWPGTGSVTSWTARYDSERDILEATWLLEAAAPSEAAWRSMQLGHDVFRRAG